MLEDVFCVDAFSLVCGTFLQTKVAVFLLLASHALIYFFCFALRCCSLSKQGKEKKEKPQWNQPSSSAATTTAGGAGGGGTSKRAKKPPPSKPTEFKNDTPKGEKKNVAALPMQEGCKEPGPLIVDFDENNRALGSLLLSLSQVKPPLGFRFYCIDFFRSSVSGRSGVARLVGSQRFLFVRSNICTNQNIQREIRHGHPTTQCNWIVAFGTCPYGCRRRHIDTMASNVRTCYIVHSWYVRCLVSEGGNFLSFVYFFF